MNFTGKMMKKSYSLMLAALLAVAAVPAVLVSSAPAAYAAEAPSGIGARGDVMNGFLQSVMLFTLPGSSSAYVDVTKKGIAADGRDVLSSLQSLVNSTSSQGGGILYFPKGTYGIKGSLDLKSNVTLVGAGTGTILRETKANSELLNITNATNIIVANMTIDQTAVTHTSGQSNHGVAISGSSKIGMKGLTLKGPFQQSGNERGDGIYIRANGTGGDSRYIVIKDCQSTGASRNGISMVGVENVWLEDVTIGSMSGKPNASLDLEPEEGYSVRKVTVKNLTASGKSLNLYTIKGEVTDILLQNIKLASDVFRIEGNVSNIRIDGSTASGMSIENDSKQTVGNPRDLLVTNSSFINKSATQTVYLTGESITFDNCEFVGGTKAAVRDVGITDRLVVKNSRIHGSPADGILVYRAKHVELSNNEIYDNARDGIMLGNKDSNLLTAKVTNNNIYNNGDEGIAIETPLADVELTGTTIRNNGDIGISLTNCASALITGNTISGNGNGIQVSSYDTYRNIYDVKIASNIISGGQEYGIEILPGPGVMSNVTVSDNTISGSLVKDLYVKAVKKGLVSPVTLISNILG